MVYRKTAKIKDKLDEREKEILRAARELLAEQNHHGVSIKAIAQKAGIAVGTFYLYFRNKEVLLNAVIDELYVELLGAIKAERSQYNDVLDKLQASMEACIKLFNREKKLAKLVLVQLPCSNKLFNTVLEEIEEELIKLTKEDLDEATALGSLPPQDTYISSIAFVGTFRQVITNWLLRGYPRDLEAAFQYLVQYNFKGLGVKMGGEK